MRSALTQLVFALVGLSVSSHLAAQEDYKARSVCEILAESNRNYTQYVAVDADLVLARPHGVVLVDQRCPGKGLLLDFPSVGEDETVAKLEKAIRDGTSPTESTGTFCGHIKQGTTNKRPVLSLHKVLNLQPKIP